MANAPLVGQDGGSCAADLPDAATEIFLREGLDRLLVICPSGCFVAGKKPISSYVDGPYWQALFGVSNDLVCFGHMSGLLVRAYDRWP
jgi:hypothetical protein